MHAFKSEDDEHAEVDDLDDALRAVVNGNQGHETVQGPDNDENSETAPDGKPGEGGERSPTVADGGEVRSPPTFDGGDDGGDTDDDDPDEPACPKCGTTDFFVASKLLPDRVLDEVDALDEDDRGCPFCSELNEQPFVVEVLE